jgi:hypothetical protein
MTFLYCMNYQNAKMKQVIKDTPSQGERSRTLTHQLPKPRQGRLGRMSPASPENTKFIVNDVLFNRC